MLLHLSEEEKEQLRAMTLGERVKFFREKLSTTNTDKKFSTREVAKRLQMAPQTLNAIERGDIKKPAFEFIHKLSKDFNIPIEAFTDEYYESKNTPDVIINYEDGSQVIFDVKTSSQEKKSKYKIGYMMYQLFDDGKLRIILNELSKGYLNEDDLIHILSQQFATIQLNNELLSKKVIHRYSTDNKSPYNKALDLYFSLLKEPEKYTIVNKNAWDKLLENDYHQTPDTSGGKENKDE
jgi:transcriptional regulator with XRE-family HTH domain